MHVTQQSCDLIARSSACAARAASALERGRSDHDGIPLRARSFPVTIMQVPARYSSSFCRDSDPPFRTVTLPAKGGGPLL